MYVCMCEYRSTYVNLTYLLNRIYLEQMNGTASAVAIEVYIMPKKSSDEILLTWKCMYVCMYVNICI